MQTINCHFETPLTMKEGNLVAPDITDTGLPFQFETMICTTTDSTSTLELIQNASTGASFNIRKEINYGDVLILTFLALFLVFGIWKMITDAIVPKRIDFKRN